jgi:mono/diheme cytochrome c family protein
MFFRSIPLAIAVFTVSAVAAEKVTFNRDVAPIIYQHCAGCHHANDIAPMSLLTYKDAKPWAAAIKEAALTRKMPPWKADPNVGKWANDPSLNAREIAAIKAWVDGGKLEGDAKDLPAAPVFTTDWKIGKPDVIIAIPEHHLTATGPDEYEYIVVPTNFTEDTWVVAAELRPSNRKVVHHAHVYVNKPEAPKADPATPVAEKPKDPVADFRKWLMVKEGKLTHMQPDAPVIDNGCAVDDNGLLPGNHPSGEGGMIASYLPGREPDVFPVGTARKIPAGATVTFQIHYSKATHKEETDITSVGLMLAKGPPEQVAHRTDLSNQMFRLPAGDPNTEVTECHTFKKDMYITSLNPHMHLRGKDMRFEVTYPDGRKETLLNVPHYNFNWQQTYKMKTPLFIPKGTRMALIAHFDNSANNPFNPDATKTIRWGEASEMEMMDGWIEYVDAVPGQPAPAALSAAVQH